MRLTVLHSLRARLLFASALAVLSALTVSGFLLARLFEQHVEARVGARLLNRNSRNVSLTEAGAQYLQSVRPLLEGLSEAEAQLTTDTLSPRGTLKISMPVILIPINLRGVYLKK